MEYRIVRVDREEPIEHALFGKKGGAQKGSTWDKHKYIAREWAGNTWKYYYNTAQLAARKATKTGKYAQNAALEAKANQAKKKADKAVAAIKRKTSDAVSDVRNNINKRTENLKTRAYETVNDAKKSAQGIPRKITRAADDLKNEAYSRYNTAKTNASRALDDAKNADYKKIVSDAGKKIGETADRAKKAATETSKKISDAGKKVGEAAKNAADSASKAVKDFKDYADDVDKRYQTNRDQNDTSKLASDMRRKSSEEAAASGDKKKAIDYENESENQASIARKAQAAADKALEESKSIKYKASDLLRSGLNSMSKLADAGKAKTDNLLSKAGSAIDSKVDKGKEWINTAKNNIASEMNYKKLESAADKAGREADKLGQKTDKLSDAAEKALKQYGRNSTQYKKAYDELTDAFEKLNKKEAELSNYERQLEAYEKNKK